MGGNKNKSAAQQEKSQNKNKKETGKKEKKKGPESKQEVKLTINEDEATKIIKGSKVITAFELAKQTNVKISTANNFLKKSLENGLVTRFGGFSGHHIYQPVLS